ncbi:neuropeptide FF receptor 2-like [Branchiostoma floridae x Branchiostoma belcheri]
MDMIDIPFEELVELLANISKTEKGREVMKSITMDRYRLSPPVIGLSILAYSLVFVLCLIGNILVLIVVIRTPRTRTITNYFILNLTISDLLVGIFCVPFTLVNHIFTENQFGDGLCKFTPLIQGVAIGASVFTLTAIALDRHRLIIHPTERKLTVKEAFGIITGIWVLSLTIMIPQVFIRREEVIDIFGQSMHICGEFWPSSEAKQIYSGFLFVLCYMGPLLLNACLYVRIGLTLWFKKPVVRTPMAAADAIKKRRVVKMLIMIVSHFALSWLPLYTCWLLDDFNALSVSQSETMHDYIYPAAHWLAFTNSVFNPIVYGYFNNHLRENFKNVMTLKAVTNSTMNRTRETL